VQAVRQAVTLDPSHEGANLLLVQVGAPESSSEAEEILRGMIETQSGEDNPEGLFLLAAAKARQGGEAGPEGVDSLLRRAVEQTPDHPKSAVAPARLKLSQGDAGGTEQVLLDNLEKVTKKAPVLATLGGFYLKQQNMEAAMEQFDSVLEVYPEYVPALVGHGLIQMRQDKKDAAEDTFQTVSQVAEGDRKSCTATSSQTTRNSIRRWRNSGGSSTLTQAIAPLALP